ncbi:MAG: DEAD/DEAH box helicase [Duncaniella sp.]|nr:DEAD/DEAH box helicase [Duncaniella sp.]
MPLDFLPSINSDTLRRRGRSDVRQGASGEFWFRIAAGTDGSAPRLLTVDSGGNPVHPDHRNYRGETASLLRAIQGIEDEERFNISWGMPEEAGIDLAKHPYLLYQLSRCGNIQGPSGEAVTVSDRPAVLVLSISRPAQAEEEKTLVPSWRLRLPACADDGGAEDFMPVSDTWALSAGTLYPTEGMGSDFANLQFFASPFSEDMLEQYLSVVYSYVENFELDFAPLRVEMSPEEVAPRPTLVFEKVDPDMALHLRVTSSVRGVDSEFLQRFDLTRVASMVSDTQIVVHPLLAADHDSDLRSVRELIMRHAPSRKEAREVYLDGDTFIIPQSVAGPFLLKALPTLISGFTLLGTDRLREYKVSPVRPKLSMKFTSGIDFLEGEAAVEVEGEKISLGKLFEQYRRDRYLTLRDGSRAVLDEQYMRRLERLFGDRKNAGKKVQVSYFDLPDIEELLNERVDPSLFRRQREVYEGFNRLSSAPLETPALKAGLRPYQAEGVKWIRYLYDNGLGGCLADDMGLGKTIQTIAMLSTIYPAVQEPTLIVMPRSLLFNWQNEIARFCPGLSAYVYYQADRDLDVACGHNVVLTTYAMVRNDIEKFSAKEFHYVILDESQNIKNVEALVTRAVYMLKAPHRLALSGTPLENNLSELYSLFRFLNPGMLGDMDDFNRRYAGPIMKEDDRDAMASLRRRIFPFMLRRLKKDVLTALPARVAHPLRVELDKAQADFYEQRRRFYYDKVNESIASEGIRKSQFVMFQALTELRRIASVPESLSDGRIRSPKLDDLADRLAEAVANGHKCVVFFNYIAGLELTGERLSAMGIDYEVMTGATANRRKVVERFTDTPSCKVFLMTLKTGGVGLNLTVADTVFIFEPWWNKAAEEQAINRLHRIGQHAKVHSYSLITRGTIEEKIRQLQERKARLFDDLISSDSSSSKQLSAEDIDFILSK